MSSNPSLYRFINFIGGNILDAANVSLLQTELQRLGGMGLGELYAQGALLNAVFNITGTSIVFTKANSSFDVLVFINNQFEDLGSTISISGTQPTSGSSNPLYLNWSLDIKTSVDDPTFVDGITGEPTIQAGQLNMQVSWTDTSGTPLNPTTQFAKNTSPIVLATFDMSVPSVVTPTYINGVFPYANGSPTQAGLVRVTDTSGLVPGNTDSRLSDERTPLPLSVDNTKIKALISSGFNSTSLPAWAANTVYAIGVQIVDSNGNIETVVAAAGTGTSGASAPTWNTSLGGQTIDNAGSNQLTWINGGPASTVKYDPATAGQGGVFTDSIIYTTLKQKLTTFLDTVNTSIQNALIALGNHIGKPLGSAQTHPFPTAFQVGAAPASHVGQVLGLGTSHPAQVNSDHAGFTVLRNPAVSPVTTDNGYAITDGTNTLSALTHPGDVFTKLTNAVVANGGNGSGGTAVFTGPLGFLSLMAQVLAEHVNYKTHGNNNPHNLNAADIGSVDAAFVDQQVSSIIADVTAYTDAVSGVSVRTNTVVGASHFISHDGSNVQNIRFDADGNPLALNTSYTDSTTMVWRIFTFGGRFEIAIGQGKVFNQDQVALPESSGWTYSQMLASGSMRWITPHYDQDQFANWVACVNPSTFIVRATNWTGSHTANTSAWANVEAVAYRTITPPPVIISSFDTTVNTFNAGHVGDTVIITGRNFGSTQGSSTVRFNGTAVATYNSWSPTSVSVVIPAGATTGLISMTVPPSSSVNSSFIFTIS